MWKIRYLLVFAVLLSLVACTQIVPSKQTATPDSGIEGTVTEGPMCPGPVRLGDNSCPNKPYETTISVLNANGIQVVEIRTDANGYFKIPLSPGKYTLHPAPGNPLPRAADQPVEVSPGQYSQVSIIYDTGMR